MWLTALLMLNSQGVSVAHHFTLTTVPIHFPFSGLPQGCLTVLPVVLLPKCYLLLDNVNLLLPFILFSRWGGFTALYHALNELSTSVLTLDRNNLTHFIPSPVGCPVNWRFSPRVSLYTICLFCSSSWKNTAENWSLNSPLHAFLLRENMCYTLQIKNVASSIHFSGCGMFSLLDKADQLSFVLCWVLVLKYQHCHFIILKVLVSLKFMKLWALIWSVMAIFHTHNFLASFTLEIISTNGIAPCLNFFFWFQVNLVTQFAAAAAKSLQSCPTLCDPIDSSPPGSPVPGILHWSGLPVPSPMHESEKWKWSRSVVSSS